MFTGQNCPPKEDTNIWADHVVLVICKFSHINTFENLALVYSIKEKNI